MNITRWAYRRIRTRPRCLKRMPVLIVFFLFFLGKAGPGFANVEPPKNPNSAKGCAICHYRWIDTFFVEGRGTELVPYQSEKVVASARMCLSCHDGSVKDSRARVNNRFGHRINQPPPEGMKIPKRFPLDEKGNLQCATCHTAHGVASGENADETIFMRTSNKNSNMCRMCHPAADGGMPAGNHPIGLAEKAVPQQLIAGGARAGTGKNQIICQTCHAAHGSPYQGYLVQNGDDSELCITCHPEKGPVTAQGRKNPVHVVNVAPKTAKIPAKLIEKGAKLSQSGKMTCLTCHKVHMNRQGPQLLLLAKDQKASLCFACHEDKRTVLDGKHNLLRSAPKEKNLDGRTVSQAGVCSACHLPHKAARQMSGQADFTTQLCLSCHGPGAFEERKNLAGRTHPLTVSPYKKNVKLSHYAPVVFGEQPLSLPLYNAFGVREKYGQMTCSTCHDPHAAQSDGRPNAQVNQDRKNAEDRFLRKPSPEICRECHSSKFAIAGSRHDLMRSAPKAENLFGQTPEQSGLCGCCHLVHGSHKGFLWAREVKTTNPSSRNQAMCVHCHTENGIANKKVNKGYHHPLNISPAERKLQTSLPLFDERDKIAADGVITCYTCHDPHRPFAAALGQPNAKKPPDQPRTNFLRVENAPSPLLCTNCHPEAAPVVKSDHDLTVTAPSSLNDFNRKPSQSGVCGACHLIHNSKNRFKLWARDPGKGKDMVERLCNSCHATKGMASHKTPRFTSHPKSDIVNLNWNSKVAPNYFPVFAPDRPEPSITGNLSCPSCHTVHRWDADSTKPGKGINLEGDATNSFLRAESWELPCRDCHGPESIMRYKFFHEAKSRKTGLNQLQSPGRVKVLQGLKPESPSPSE